MDDQSRLKQTLGRALPETLAEDGPATDPATDLARARAALRARTRRRFRVGLGALTLVVVAGIGLTAVVDRGPADPTTPDATTGTAPGTVAPITLVDAPLHAAPYSFDLTPRGWTVQARTPYVVTIVPKHAHTSSDPYVFVGKLVITFDHEGLRGRHLVVPGSARDIRVGSDSAYTTLSMRTTDDEPTGVVRIQYPDDAGWERATMARFLLSVHVGPGVRASQG